MNIKILSLVSVLAWCVAANASQDNSKVLVTMNGKPLITEQQLKQEMEKAPIISKDNVLNDMINQKVVNKYIADNKLDASPEYLQKFQKMSDEAKNGLNAAYHAQALNIPIDRSEVANKYISDQKIDTSPNYQQQLKQRLDDSKSYLNLSTFDNLIPANLSISETELQKYYNERKNHKWETFEKMKEYIRSDINRQNHRDKVDAEIERLKKEYKIVVVAKPS